MLGDERSNGCNDQYDAWNPQGVALCENRGSGKGHDAPVLDARETLHREFRFTGHQDRRQGTRD